jgi:hypothetical protein
VTGEAFEHMAVALLMLLASCVWVAVAWSQSRAKKPPKRRK